MKSQTTPCFSHQAVIGQFVPVGDAIGVGLVDVIQVRPLKRRLERFVPARRAPSSVADADPRTSALRSFGKGERIVAARFLVAHPLLGFANFVHFQQQVAIERKGAPGQIEMGVDDGAGHEGLRGVEMKNEE